MTDSLHARSGIPPFVTLLAWSDNQGPLLAATLDSLLAQSWPHTELVIVDAMSTDGSVEIITDYVERYPALIRHLTCAPGVPRLIAELTFSAEYRGEYVALCSAGACPRPDWVEAALADLQTTPNLGVVCTQVEALDSKGQPLSSANLVAINSGDAIMRRRLLHEGEIIDADTCVLRTRYLQATLPDPGLVHAGHLPLWLRILDEAEILRHNEKRVRRTTSGVPAPDTLAHARHTVASIIQALRRWRLDRMFHFNTPADSPQHSIETAAAHAQLAKQLIELDRRFFGRPALGCYEAYMHALEAIRLCPSMIEAQEAVNQIESSLGESPDGKRLLADWQNAPLANLPMARNSSSLAECQTYQQWQKKHAIRDIDGQYLAEHMVQRWQSRPEFAVLILMGDDAIAAPQILPQLYPQKSTYSPLTSIKTLGEALTCLGESEDSDWLVLLPATSRLASTALMYFAEAINRDPSILAWYADDEIGEPPNIRPRFKPDFDPLLALGHEYLGCLAVRRDVAQLFPSLPWNAATPLALVLTLHAKGLRNAVGHIQEILATLSPFAPQAADTAIGSCIARHLEANATGAQVTPAGDGLRTIHWPRREPPRVTVICLTPPGTQAESAAILPRRTTYPNLEYIEIAQTPRVPGLTLLAGESFASACWRAAQAARGELIVFVGPEDVPDESDWLEDAVALMQAGNYAAVGIAGGSLDGACLWSAGVVLGLGGGFGSLHANQDESGMPGHLGRLRIAHEVSALPARGLLIKRDIFLNTSGFDPQWELPEACATDFCLRLTRHGARLAWTPYGCLRRPHPDFAWPAPSADHQFALRDRFIASWLPRLAADPYWNRHLSLTSPEGLPEDDLVFRWNPDFHDRLRVLALPMPASGQAEYRVSAPLRALDQAGLVQAMEACEPSPGRERAPTPIELARLAPDTLYLQAAFDDVRFNGLRAAARFNPEIFRIFSLDDRVSDMPDYNASSKGLPRDVVIRRMREALACCDRLVVSTEPLAEVYRDQIDDIVVVPNRLERARWGKLTPAVNTGPRPRVGWAGALQHAGDLAMIREVVETLAGEVDWVFFGMIPAGCEPFLKEFHGTVPLDAYPAKLASLALDLAVAPLTVNLFNESKSNLRLLEYGIFGWPVVCTDIYPFRTNNAPVCRVQNDAGRWIDAIREHLADREALHRAGQELKAWVERHYMLEDHLDDWLAALTPDRK